MEPVSFAAAIPGILSAGYKFLNGNNQVKKGEALAAANKRPIYTRPREVTQALNLADRNYTNGMPGAGLYRNDINTNSAAAFSKAKEGASSSGDVLDAATKINYNTNLAYNDIAKQEEAYKAQALSGYLGQLNNNANYTDKEFSYNQDDPYRTTAAAASALIGAGNQNKFNGIDEGLGMATNILNQQNMGEKTGNPTINKVQSLGVTNNGGGFSNPALLGKWIVDASTGAKRWVAN